MLSQNLQRSHQIGAEFLAFDIHITRLTNTLTFPMTSQNARPNITILRALQWEGTGNSEAITATTAKTGVANPDMHSRIQT